MSFSPEDIRNTLGFPPQSGKKNDVKTPPVSYKHIFLGYCLAVVFVTAVLSGVVYFVWNYGIAPFGAPKVGILQSIALALGLEALGVLKRQ